MSTATESRRNRTRRWLWPLLVIAALTWGGHWWLSRGRGPDVAVDETAPTSATGGAEKGAANPGSSPQSGFDLERFLNELLGSGAAFGRGVPNGSCQDLPEAMRTVVSTRQGESLTRLSSCPSVS